MLLSQSVDPKNFVGQIVRELMPSLDLDHGPWVAGGAARRIMAGIDEVERDIDVFFPNEALLKWFDETLQKLPGYSRGHDCDTSKTVSVKYKDIPLQIQLIKQKYFSNAFELLDDFDLTVAMFATDGETILHTQQAKEDLHDKLLRINRKNKKPRPYRLIRYCDYGFTPLPGVLTSLMGIDTPEFSPNPDLRAYDY